jgi:hypothetical protein
VKVLSISGNVAKVMRGVVVGYMDASALGDPDTAKADTAATQITESVQKYDRKTDDVRILLDRVMTGLILHEETAFDLLSTVSYLRGGMGKAGSVVWADIDEFKDEEVIGMRQIVGHTQQLKKESCKTPAGSWTFRWVPDEPVTHGSITCIDNHRCYYLDEDDRLFELATDKEIN